MGVENYIFWSEIGSGFEESGGTPPPRIPRSTFPPPGRKVFSEIELRLLQLILVVLNFQDRICM